MKEQEMLKETTADAAEEGTADARRTTADA